MKPEMPTLGKPARTPVGRAVAVLLLVAVAIGTFVFFRTRGKPAPTSPPKPAPSESKPAAAPAAAAEAQAEADGGATAAAETAGKAAPAPAEAAADAAAKKAGYRRVHAVINGPLETALVQAVGRDLGVPLTQVAVRTLVWWVEVPGDLRKGDTLDLLVVERAGEEPRIDAVRFKSEKLGKTFRAYRYQGAGDGFARFYEPDGHELERRLQSAPLDDYEQVTSLLRDGRGHKGVDFKTPVGSPVKAPFDAEVVRKNWNWKGNGNSVELRETGGKHRTAMFLHLSEVAPEVKPGATVSHGQVIAKSGNTGHSFAPHLHYQLQAPDGKILDPFSSFETERRALPADQKSAFESTVQKDDQLLQAS
jgi:murein DD-endopeptidase MepM/ murein hydrolase activator NlpD